MMIIDAHIHRGMMAAQYVYDLSLERLLESMDFLGIGTAISSHCLSLMQGDFDGGTEAALKDYEFSGGRIKSFFYYDARFPERSLGVMRELENNPVFCGIKIHPSWSFTYADDEAYRPVWEYARERRLPILSHSWDVSAVNVKQKYSHPARFEKYLAEFPEVQLVLAHSGGRYRAIKCAAGLARKYGNLAFDIAGDIAEDGFLEYLVREAGSGRIMYGSDCPMMDQKTMLGVVYGADIELCEKEDILYNTARRIYLGGADGTD